MQLHRLFAIAARFIVIVGLVPQLRGQSVSQPTHSPNMHAPRTAAAGIGVVRFPNSGNARAQPAFLRGIALLHSFAYREAAAAFRDAEQADPRFALPYWFEALTNSPVLWSIDDAPAARRALSRLAATPAERLRKAGNARERAYGAAVEAFFADTDLTSRTKAFADSLSALAVRDTTDLEASAFASIGVQMYLQGRSMPVAERQAYESRAIAFADRVFRANPNHPGAAHYLIHISDLDNSFSTTALPAAFAYARIAPAVEHAQHMPSHIFIKLGLWDDQVAANERAWSTSVAEGLRDHRPTTELDYHDFTWLQYGYLQQGRWRAARAMIDSAQRMIAGHDNDSTAEVDAHYAPAMLQFGYANETGRWTDGPQLPLASHPVGEAAYRAREMSMLRATNVERVMMALLRGDTTALSLVSQVAPDSTLPSLELHALAAEVRHDTASAIATWRRAAAIERGQAVVGPPRYLMANERLASLLLASGHATEAADQFMRASVVAPNRASALLGLARARFVAGDTAGSAMAYRRVLENWHKADDDLPALAEVRRGASLPESRLRNDSAPLMKKRVMYRSGALMLSGFMFKPAGAGPFPAVVWNHGSERNPGASAQFDSIAAVFVPRGYVVFAPTRRGHDQNDGTHVSELRARMSAEHGDTAGDRLTTRLLETEQLADQMAGVSFLARQPFVDTSRMVVAGCSFGGIQTLLAAEGKSTFKAAVSMSPAAMNWGHNAPLRERLLGGVSRIRIPVMLLQPPRDVSLGPSRDLGAEFARQHKAYRGIVYPDTLPPQLAGHCFGGNVGDRVWANDVLTFVDSVLARR